MPGAPNMKMYSRDDLMKNNFGTEGDEDDEDDDEEEDSLPKNLVCYHRLPKYVTRVGSSQFSITSQPNNVYLNCWGLIVFPLLLPGKHSKKQGSAKERPEAAGRETDQGYRQETERACEQGVQGGEELVEGEEEACKIQQKRAMKNRQHSQIGSAHQPSVQNLGRE